MVSLSYVHLHSCTGEVSMYSPADAAGNMCPQHPSEQHTAPLSTPELAHVRVVCSTRLHLCHQTVTLSHIPQTALHLLDAGQAPVVTPLQDAQPRLLHELGTTGGLPGCVLSLKLCTPLLLRTAATPAVCCGLLSGQEVAPLAAGPEHQRRSAWNLADAHCCKLLLLLPGGTCLQLDIRSLGRRGAVAGPCGVMGTPAC